MTGQADAEHPGQPPGPMNSVDRAFASVPLPPLLVSHLVDFPAGSFTLEELRRRVETRAPDLAALRLASPGHGGRAWVPTALPDPKVHVVQAFVAGRLDEATDRVVRTPLPVVPAWELCLLTAEGVQRLCFRIDHAITDGVGATHLLAALLADEPAGGAHPYRRPATARPSLAWLAALPWRRVQPRRAVPRGFTTEVSGTPVTAHADFPEPALRRLAAALGVPVNDVYLAALAHALGGWQRDHGSEAADLLVLMPMSVRTAGAKLRVGNRALGGLVRLPCTRPSPRDCLAVLTPQLERRKRSGLREHGWTFLTRVPYRFLLRAMLQTGIRLGASHINLNGSYRVLGAPLLAASVVSPNVPGLLGYFGLTRTASMARISLVHDQVNAAAAELPGRCVRSLEELMALADSAVEERR